MFESLGRSWELYKVCWNLLAHDKELILFPMLSLISLGMTLGAVFGTGMVDRLAQSIGNELSLVPSDYVVIGVFYFINYFMVVYFNAAIIGSARIRFHGGDPTLMDGLRVANQNIVNIIGWAFISAVVSLIFYAIEKQASVGGRSGGVFALIALILSKVAQVAWSVITYLVIPVLVVEGVGPIEAIKRSASMVRKTWGEQLASRFGFDLMLILFAIPILLLAGLGWVILPGQVGVVLGVAIAVVGIGLLILTTAALRGIYMAALYEYASTGSIPQGFSEQVVVQSWQPRTVVESGGGSGGGGFTEADYPSRQPRPPYL